MPSCGPSGADGLGDAWLAPHRDIPWVHSVLLAVLLCPLHLQTPRPGIPPLQVMRCTGGAGVQPCVCVCVCTRVCTCVPPGQPPLRVHVCACSAGSTAGSHRPPLPPPRLHRHRGPGGGRRPGGQLGAGSGGAGPGRRLGPRKRERSSVRGGNRGSGGDGRSGTWRGVDSPNRGRQPGGCHGLPGWGGRGEQPGGGTRDEARFGRWVTGAGEVRADGTREGTARFGHASPWGSGVRAGAARSGGRVCG